MQNRTTYIARTAVILALTLVFQMSRVIIQPLLGPGHIFIVGSLVNLALIVATAQVGIGAAILISITAPIVAFIQGHIPSVPIIIPLVAFGNIALVLAFSFFKKTNEYVAVIIGATVKFLTMLMGLNLLIAILGSDAKLAKIFGALSFGFGWPQLVTALIGGYLAVLISKTIAKQQATKK